MLPRPAHTMRVVTSGLVFVAGDVVARFSGPGMSLSWGRALMPPSTLSSCSQRRANANIRASNKARTAAVGPPSLLGIRPSGGAVAQARGERDIPGPERALLALVRAPIRIRSDRGRVVREQEGRARGLGCP